MGASKNQISIIRPRLYPVGAAEVFFRLCGWMFQGRAQRQELVKCKEV
jgi:hypothetical protein